MMDMVALSFTYLPQDLTGSASHNSLHYITGAQDGNTLANGPTTHAVLGHQGHYSEEWLRTNPLGEKYLKVPPRCKW